MKELIGRLQKDLHSLQKTLAAEIDELSTKLKNVAHSETVSAKTREIEKLLESKMKRFEPAMEKFYKDVKKNAEKYGIDLSGIEKKVKEGIAATRKAGAKKKKVTKTKKTAPAKASKATPRAKKASRS